MRKGISLRIIACFLIAGCLNFSVNAQPATPTNPTPAGGSDWTIWALGSLLLFIIATVFYLTGKMSSISTAEKSTASFASWWASLDKRFFTKAIPVDNEADRLLDHDYDGIKELDNSLPPWWKYGFYFTIVVAVVYFLRFHVWKTGPDPEQEYNTEMQLAARQIEEYRKKAGDMIDEKTVTMADANGIAEGGKLFQTTCMACHGGKGEGGVGPNLTDNYWLHGGTINDVFKTIKFGVPDKGMQSWEKTYSPSQIKSIASYIKSIAGTNPPNGKAPQGNLFEEKPTAAKDSATVVKQ